jgi:hypothetical protein|tara:strand:+ start:319 stop:627 length:309 start_codon:yes stop_codon:yes gene_type:complete
MTIEEIFKQSGYSFPKRKRDEQDKLFDYWDMVCFAELVLEKNKPTDSNLSQHLVSKCCAEHIEERDLYVDPSDGRMFCNQCGKTLNAEIMKMKRDKATFNVC